MKKATIKREPIVLTKTGEAFYLTGLAISLSLILFAGARVFGYLVVWIAGLI